MSSIRTRARRIAPAASVIAAGGAVALLAPTAAQAYSPGGGTLVPGGQTCTAQQWAGYQARGEGTATRSGARFTVYRNGVVIYQTPTGTTSGFAAEFRSSYGTFPGAGYYQVCAKNPNSTNTSVTLLLTTDSEVH